MAGTTGTIVGGSDEHKSNVTKWWEEQYLRKFWQRILGAMRSESGRLYAINVALGLSWTLVMVSFGAFVYWSFAKEILLSPTLLMAFFTGILCVRAARKM
jgi:hypothetical protein